jgi:hypothetical protein
MKLAKSLAQLFFIYVLICNITLLQAHVKSPIISIEDAYTLNKIALSIKGNGQHKGNSTIFDVENKSQEAIILHLEFGRRLICEDSLMQDLLIVKEQLITLQPKERKNINGFAFCCQSNYKCPKKDIEFKVGYMAPADWIKLSEVINKNKFPEEAVQNAIWAISDNHEIGSIHTANMEDIQLLRETVASIKNIELPWYSIFYLKDSERVFSGKHYKLKGKFEYNKKNNGITTIQIRNKSGRIMTASVKNAAQGPGTYQYPVDLNITGWPKGEYEFLVFEDQSQLILKKAFTL